MVKPIPVLLVDVPDVGEDPLVLDSPDKVKKRTEHITDVLKRIIIAVLSEKRSTQASLLRHQSLRTPSGGTSSRGHEFSHGSAKGKSTTTRGTRPGHGTSRQ